MSKTEFYRVLMCWVSFSGCPFSPVIAMACCLLISSVSASALTEVTDQTTCSCDAPWQRRVGHFVNAGAAGDGQMEFVRHTADVFPAVRQRDILHVWCTVVQHSLSFGGDVTWLRDVEQASGNVGLRVPLFHGHVAQGPRLQLPLWTDVRCHDAEVGIVADAGPQVCGDWDGRRWLELLLDHLGHFLALVLSSLLLTVCLQCYNSAPRTTSTPEMLDHRLVTTEHVWHDDLCHQWRNLFLPCIITLPWTDAEWCDGWLRWWFAGWHHITAIVRPTSKWFSSRHCELVGVPNYLSCVKTEVGLHSKDVSL